MKPVRRSPKNKAASAAKSSNRAVMAMAVLGSLVLLYGWNSVFLAPRSKARAETATQLAAAKKSESDLRQQLGQLRKLAADSQSREAELARYGRLIPADADVAGAIMALDGLAEATQVAWSSFTPSTPAASPGGPAAVTLTINIGGTFHQILDYLRRLESLERLVVVDTVALSGAGAGGAGSPVLGADLKARMFVRDSAVPATAAKAKAKAATAESPDTAALTEGAK